MFKQTIRAGPRQAAPAMRMVRSSRSYATTGGNDAAESKADTGPFKSTWVLTGGGTALVGGVLATMMGSPDATVAAAKNADPEGQYEATQPNKDLIAVQKYQTFNLRDFSMAVVFSNRVTQLRRNGGDMRGIYGGSRHKAHGIWTVMGQNNVTSKLDKNLNL